MITFNLTHSSFMICTMCIYIPSITSKATQVGTMVQKVSNAVIHAL